MNKFLERSILDELYEAKCDDFAKNIQNKIPAEKSFLKEEQLKNKIMQFIKNDKKQKEVLRKLNEYELEVGTEQDFWNKMYYKLGIYNCTEMKEILLDKIECKNNQETFFDKYTDDFLDYLESNRRKSLNKNIEYKKLEQRIEEIKENNPNVRTFLEEREAVILSDVELNSVLDIIELQGDINTIEIKETFKLGAREMFVFINKMKLL